jgi:hypothetical protein
MDRDREKNGICVDIGLWEQDWKGQTEEHKCSNAA